MGLWGKSDNKMGVLGKFSMWYMVQLPFSLCILKSTSVKTQIAFQNLGSHVCFCAYFKMQTDPKGLLAPLCQRRPRFPRQQCTLLYGGRWAVPGHGVGEKTVKQGSRETNKTGPGLGFRLTRKRAVFKGHSGEAG